MKPPTGLEAAVGVADKILSAVLYPDSGLFKKDQLKLDGQLH